VADHARERGSSRRAFLRDFARNAAGGMREVTGAEDEPLPSPSASLHPPASAPPAAPPRSPARAAERCLSVDELLALAAEEGLPGRDAALRRLARRSVRLTPPVDGEGGARDEAGERDGAGDGDAAGAWLGGVPSLAAGDEWPAWAAGRLSAVAQLDLADPALEGFAAAAADPARAAEAGAAEAGGAWPFPRAGRLLFFFDTDRAPSGLQAAQRGAARVLLEPQGTVAARGGQPLRLSTELTLPRVWAPAVAALGLDGDEHDAYVRVRRELALRQGVEPEDDGGPSVAYHRLLGHPDETSGTMERVCELTARELDAAPPSQLDLVSASDASRWRLLLQLTVEEPLAWRGEPGVRLFFWIAAEDLAAGDLSRVWAIPR
jgi:hypothetical protein